MKLAHISDTHVEEGSRLEELTTCLDVFVTECGKAKVDLVLHTGDLFHKKSTPTERNIAAEFLRRCAEHAPVILVKGNHDATDDLEIYGRIKSKYPIVAVQRPRAIGLFCGADVHCIPWFDKASLVSTLEVTTNAQETTRRVVEAANQLLVITRTRMQQSRANGRIPILAGHLLVMGSEVSSGQTMIGITVEISAHDLLDTGAAYVGLGHVHKAQEWFNGRVAYPGSPIRQNFGEDEPKGFRLVEIDPDPPYAIRNDFIELPARGIVLLEVDWTTDAALKKLREEGITILATPSARRFVSQDSRVQGALVRFRYHIHPKDMHLVNEDAIRKLLFAEGAYEVKIEPKRVEQTRIRSEAIVTAQSVWEKVQAFLLAKEITLTADEASRLEQRLGDLQSQE